MTEDNDGYIDYVQIGGENAWYMLGHTFWNERFSKKFLEILTKIYHLPETRDALWERIFIEHLEELKMRIRKYPENYIFEFDTLDELRLFDSTYVKDSRSIIMKNISNILDCKECDITQVTAFRGQKNEAEGFRFIYNRESYEYVYENGKLRKI